MKNKKLPFNNGENQYNDNGDFILSSSQSSYIRRCDGECCGDYDDSLRRGYSSNPSNLYIFHKDYEDTGNTTIGLELEFDGLNNPDFWEDLSEKDISNWIFKEDGSLDDDGVECVTLPFTEGYYNSCMRDNITRVIKSGIRYGQVHSETGLHIHIGRNNLSDLDLCKIYYFINNKDNKTIIEKIAGRRNNRRTNFTELKDKISGLRNDRTIKQKYSQGREKYSAVNLSHDNTIEIRIFVNSKSITNTLGRVEFIFALVTFVKNTIQKRITMEEFIKFVLKNKTQYPNFIKLLQNKDIDN